MADVGTNAVMMCTLQTFFIQARSWQYKIASLTDQLLIVANSLKCQFDDCVFDSLLCPLIVTDC